MAVLVIAEDVEMTVLPLAMKAFQKVSFYILFKKTLARFLQRLP